MIEVSLKSSDLLYLSVSLYEVQNSKGVILIVPGLNEYKERYKEFINYLNNNGYSVVIYDPRGQGKSTNDLNKLGVINDDKKLINDFNIIISYIKNRFINKTIYLVADSLGALTALCTLDSNELIKKVVLISPLYQDNINTNLKTVKSLLNFYGKDKESTFFQNILGFGKKCVILKDLGALSLLKNDPNCFYNYKNISVYQILKMEENIKSLKYRNNFKLLILTGVLDVTLSGKENVCILLDILRKNNCLDITCLEYHNMGHKILFEPSRTLVYQDILNFFTNS